MKEYIEMTLKERNTEIKRLQSTINITQPRRNILNTYGNEVQRENSKYQTVRHATQRKLGAIRCNLCLAEKLFIQRADQGKTLSKRTELFSKN